MYPSNIHIHTYAKRELNTPFPFLFHTVRCSSFFLLLLFFSLLLMRLTDSLARTEILTAAFFFSWRNLKQTDKHTHTHIQRKKRKKKKRKGEHSLVRWECPSQCCLAGVIRHRKPLACSKRGSLRP